MKKIITPLLVLLFVLSSFTLRAQKGTVSGKLTDADTQSPIGYASVMLLNPADSAVVTGDMSDKDGAFAIQNITAGTYLVKVSYMGYLDWFSEPFKLSGGSHDLGTIGLRKDSKMLEGATVVYKKPLFEQKAGKTVMNVESHPGTAGDNVLELLRKMPGVMVDNSDNISLQGKSGVLILIDDRDPHLSGDDLANFLKSMPATMIDRVEVMKNPSARYDAAGTSGIINLVTKKEHRNGINGSVWAGLDYNGSFGTNDGFNLTARVGKWTLSGSYYYMFHQSKNGYDGTSVSLIQGDTIKQTANELADEFWNNKSTANAHGINFAADCYIDSVNTLSFSYQGNLFNANWANASKNRIYRNSELVQAFENNSLTKMNHGNHQMNINFKHAFDTIGTVLYADATYSINHSRNHTDREQPFYAGNFLTPLYSAHYTALVHPSRMHVATAKIDFEHPVNDLVSIECGVKTSFARNNNNSVNFLNDSLLENKSNHFIYNENIAAAYLQATFQVDRQLSIQTGLRAEYTHLKGNLLTTGEINKQDYIDVFPSLQLDYQLPKMNTLSFAYRSRISRPNYRSLNPYVDIDDQYNYSTGNPHLKPTYMQSFSVDYSWRYMLFLTAGYAFIQGTEEDMLYTDKVTNVKMTRPENIGKMHCMELSAFANIPVGKWWMMMWSVNYSLGKQYFKYETTNTSSLVSVVQLYTMHTFTFCKHYSIEIACWWMPQHKETFGTTKGMFFAWGGFKASFFKDAFTVRLGVQDIFNNSQWVNHAAYPDGTVTDMRWKGQSRGVNLNLTYRFGNNRIQMRQRKGHDDEFDRMGGGSGQGGQGSGNRVQGTGM